MKQGKWHRTIVVDDTLWDAWQLACVIHKVKMSDAIRQLMTWQLTEWAYQARGQAPALDGMGEAPVDETPRALLDIARRYIALYPGHAGQPQSFFETLYEDALAVVRRVESLAAAVPAREEERDGV